MLVAAYVDDILIISKSRDDIKMIGENLSKVFSIRNLGDVNCCLGIEFIRRKSGYSIHQRGFILDVIARFRMTECKTVSIPMDVSTKLSRSTSMDDKEDNKVPYRELIGSLMYIAMGTRPDITHAVSYLSYYNDCHRHAHWIAAKRVLRYLKATLDLAITYELTDKQPLVGFVDADWGNCPDDRRSYTGYAFILVGSCITWESRKQRTVALSSTEAEYIGISDAFKEAIYLRKFLKEL
ncbi:uncharacterized protein [Anoplolepis gracilipes]|uniref:uncharacterized protein n=1 Tax=Anoplolepis gracilipes TaxID=354296 RepID=UPI003BA05F2C